VVTCPPNALATCCASASVAQLLGFNAVMLPSGLVSVGLVMKGLANGLLTAPVEGSKLLSHCCQLLIPGVVVTELSAGLAELGELVVVLPVVEADELVEVVVVLPLVELGALGVWVRVTGDRRDGIAFCADVNSWRNVVCADGFETVAGFAGCCVILLV
jgi:hypothetical protein